MHLLYEREQSAATFRLVPLQIGGGVMFTLWAKAELDADEQELLSKYGLEKALLIADISPAAMQRSIRAGVLLGIVVWLVLNLIFSWAWALGLGVLAVIGLSAFYYNELRETIYVRDLVHGRRFRCFSVVELVRKEEYLKLLSLYLRQVIESAKHWGGRETIALPVMAPEDARQLLVRGPQWP